MKKLLIPFLSVFILLNSCKKDKAVNTDEVRLLSAKTTDSAGHTYQTDFSYDATGRISQVDYTVDGKKSDGSIATITYSGNDFTITWPTSNDPNVNVVHVIKYKLNANNQAYQRMQSDIFYMKDNLATQTAIETDTTTYFYDAEGLLTKTLYSLFDSTWYNPVTGGGAQTSAERSNSTRNFTNTGNMMTHLTINTATSFNYSPGSLQTSGTSTSTEDYSFEYNNRSPNKTDFKNSVLLAEFFVLYNYNYPLNKAYIYVPDKVTYTEISQNGPSAPISTFNRTTNNSYTYNKYGFISSLVTSKNRTEYIYNY